MMVATSVKLDQYFFEPDDRFSGDFRTGVECRTPKE
jgi:hypothetical protein